MFISKFETLANSTEPKLQSRIQSVVQFSKACTKLGLHPAQGIRIAKRVNLKQYTIMQSNVNVTTIQQIAANAHTHVTLNKNTNVQALSQLQPDHFLVHTMLPLTLNKINGYVSPILNIQPDIHFIRTQRRFNKRRYARVRAISRPSFWTGMMLSTIATGAFWGSTIQATDWLTTCIIIPDPAVWLLVGYISLSYQSWKLYTCVGVPYKRELNRSRRGWVSKINL